VVPSELRRLYWTYTFWDIRVKTRLYLGREQAKVVQEYQTFATLLSQVFGGSDSNKNKNETPEQMQAALDRMLG